MLLELLQERRSIRRYSEEEVKGEDVQTLVQAALLSPTSRDSQPWQFVIVDDETLLQKLAQAKAGGSSFVAGADLAIVVAADPELSDVWIEDCAIATTNMHNMAAALGLGSCWVQIRRRQRQDGGSSEKFVRDVLDMPGGYRVDCLLAVGHPDEEKEAYQLEDLPYDRIHYNQYGQDTPD